MSLILKNKICVIIGLKGNFQIEIIKYLIKKEAKIYIFGEFSKNIQSFLSQCENNIHFQEANIPFKSYIKKITNIEKIDYLFTNIEINVKNTTWEIWNNIYGFNVLGAIIETLPYMKEQKMGRIMISIFMKNYSNNIYQNHYVATKNALKEIVKNLNFEFQKDQITTQIISQNLENLNILKADISTRKIIKETFNIFK